MRRRTLAAALVVGALVVVALIAGGRHRGRAHGKLGTAVASVYHLHGHRLACGGRMRAGQLGVAHRTLPCGTKVTLQYHSARVTVRVIDRGPFVSGRDFDLTAATARRLNVSGVKTIRWRIAGPLPHIALGFGGRL
jgi:rare lipoprotein A (peptidoglycan hydrolase)